jgi:hypothetical protein
MYEGKQFYVSSIDIVGSADPGLLNDLPLKPGRVYNVRPVDLFLQRHLRGADVNAIALTSSLAGPDARLGVSPVYAN